MWTISSLILILIHTTDFGHYFFYSDVGKLNNTIICLNTLSYCFTEFYATDSIKLAGQWYFQNVHYII